MGIYDRDYYRQEPQRQRSGLTSYLPHTAVGQIIAINVVVWLIDGLLTPDHWLCDTMAVHVGTLTRPWLWWQFLTAGFAHAPSLDHVLINMLTLFFLGREVEDHYGRKEFMRLYLIMVVFASFVWCVVNYVYAVGPSQKAIDLLGLAAAKQLWLENVSAYGASGAIAGVVALYALNFPNRTLLLYFVIPIPAWLLGVMVVGYDMLGASGRGGAPNVAYSMHLAGAAFALAYFWFGWNFASLTNGITSRLAMTRGPKLRVHAPPDEPAAAEERPTENLGAEVDRILEKIYREGETSLTHKERKTLEAASREYQRRSEDRK